VYIIRDHHTREIVAVTTSYADALALIRTELDNRTLEIEEA
jgi:hypothetical protein